MKTSINLGYIHMESWKTNKPLFSKWMLEDEEYIEEIKSAPPDEIILPSNQNYTLEISYPLTNSYTTDINTGDKGLTRKEVVQNIIKVYKDIYSQEKNPGHIPGMYNRAKSEGKFGIWGHDLCDLILHTLYVNEDKLTVGIDS